MNPMSASGTSKRRRPILFAVGLLLLASVVKVPAVYFCPEMGALPRPCCTRQAPDGLGGTCCRFIAMDQAGVVEGTVTLPPALPAGDGQALLPASPPAVALLPGRLSRHRDPDRASPPPLHILLSVFLC
jgi:hypothetical protein